MNKDEWINFFLNMFLHMILLFSLLSAVFFFYISTVTTHSINQQFKKIINTNVQEILQDIYQVDKNHKIPWPQIGVWAQKQALLAHHELPSIVAHNEQLKNNVICVILLAIFTWLFWSVYFNWKNFQVNLGWIIIENFIILALVGLIELLFFLNVASKYVPVNPSALKKEIIGATLEKIHC